MRRIIRIVILALATMFAISCSNENISYKKGEQYFVLGEYYQAALYFGKSYRRIPTKDKLKRADRLFRMGDCYRRINNPQKAMQALQNAVRYQCPDSMVLLYLGNQQLKLANYKGAKDSFTAYLQKDPANELARSGLLS